MGHSFPFTDILKSIPGTFGIRLEEEPKFDVVETSDEIEVRRYRPALLAEITLPGGHDRAVDQAFDRLSAYIFGENSTQAKMHMTIPVYQREGVSDAPWMKAKSGEWTIGFFLGNDLAPEDVPKPTDKSIQLRTVPARSIAVVRYTGNNTDERRAEARDKLRGWLALHPEYRADTSVYWAQYDAPFVVPFLKRNEAQVALIETV